MQSARIRILCTEDDADTRELINLALTTNNCEVITSEAPAQAIELAMAAHFDLYLIDNWMPSMSGTDLCGALRLFDAETPILFYSAAAYPTDKAEAYACGAQGYLVKPADTDELIAEVFRLISESRAKRATAQHLRSTHDVSGHHIQVTHGEIRHAGDFIIDDEAWDKESRVE